MTEPAEGIFRDPYFDFELVQILFKKEADYRERARTKWGCAEGEETEESIRRQARARYLVDEAVKAAQEEKLFRRGAAFLLARGAKDPSRTLDFAQLFAELPRLVQGMGDATLPPGVSFAEGFPFVSSIYAKVPPKTVSATRHVERILLLRLTLSIIRSDFSHALSRSSTLPRAQRVREFEPGLLLPLLQAAEERRYKALASVRVLEAFEGDVPMLARLKRAFEEPTGWLLDEKETRELVTKMDTLLADAGVPLEFKNEIVRERDWRTMAQVPFDVIDLALMTDFANYLQVKAPPAS